jgi:hypothetical protein
MVTRRESDSFQGRRMSNEPTVAHGPELGRWILVSLVLLIGLALFFMYAPGSAPPAPPAAHEAS